MALTADRIRLAFAGVGVAVVSVFFLFVDLGGTVEGSPSPLSAIPIAIWALPLLLYVRAVTSRIASAAGGLALNALVVWALVALFRDTHSTSGIGVLTLPMLLGLVAALIVVLDSVSHRWARRSPGSGPEG
ncbi:MAG TPA: hypothetical protein VHG90_14560 [Acidimicrobiales bacterium]|nr:hypothetical protein [Acidimicrobiales bacterium]